jgi:hypothetical protein
LINNRQFEEAIASFNQIKNQLNLENLKTITGGYSRNILSTKNGWMTLINWDSDAITPIHGHPDFAFVYMVSGELINSPYDKQNNTLQKSSTIKAGEYFYDSGEKNQLDNSPHMLQANTPAISLHFYSSDGRDGKIYNS